jgi:ubiquinone/menaquinone biosynthesis C-methylase UbiE
MAEKKQFVCPVGAAWGLDNIFRKIFHNPKRILGKHIKEGMTVLDIGCGPGFFTLEIAKMVGNSGKVIAADLQDGMLDRLKKKIHGTDIEKRIRLHKCKKDKIGVIQKIDFVLAFYMVHEVPNHKKMFKEIYSILKQNGKFLIIEPKFHVSEKEFDETIKSAAEAGFKPVKTDKIPLSRAMLLRK